MYSVVGSINDPLTATNVAQDGINKQGTTKETKHPEYITP